MSAAAELPVWVAILTAALVLLGAALALVGSIGLLRLRGFYDRVHAPTLGATLGAGSIALASMIYFSALETRPVLHEALILIFVAVTTPVTLMILVRAALFRDRAENDDPLLRPGEGVARLDADARDPRETRG
ncbi:monovalent cation/H(+) antiporter subunit G [Hansschlegelia beijingensis]|uniref:Multicomponent K+:H+ antiporter subunit G n=1 Tax=Hansschlegelia beijingensis TaxID=1133344 RepID=A0A7W6D4L4_9HYPH|nr:monovalent cation/H(+) antiporter subunit G [Hansschlegelia beijingensis]MBB3974220.1 multicomponent K+:H+ antiporter subunit G [Hansschlegelia beijingensis]